MRNIVTDFEKIKEKVLEDICHTAHHVILHFEGGDSVVFELYAGYDAYEGAEIDLIHGITSFDNYDRVRFGLCTQEEIEKEKAEERRKFEKKEEINRLNRLHALKETLADFDPDNIIWSPETAIKYAAELNQWVSLQELEKEFEGKTLKDIVEG